MWVIYDAILWEVKNDWLVNWLVPEANLPSYIDDVLEYADLAAFPVTWESGKIYVAIDTSLSYRWSWSTYTVVWWSWDMLKSENLSWLTDYKTALQNLWVNWEWLSIVDTVKSYTDLWSWSLLWAVSVAFDWTDLWVVCEIWWELIAKVTTAWVVTTYTFSPWFWPQKIAFDWTNMWVTWIFGQAIAKVAPTWTITEYAWMTYIPISIVFDWVNMWTCWFDWIWMQWYITKISPAWTFTHYPITKSSNAITFDWTDLWTVNKDNTVSKITTVWVETPYTVSQSNGTSITFDWTDLWILYTDILSQIDTTWTELNTYPITTGSQSSLYFDWTVLWITHYTADLTKFTLAWVETIYSLVWLTDWWLSSVSDWTYLYVVTFWETLWKILTGVQVNTDLTTWWTWLVTETSTNDLLYKRIVPRDNTFTSFTTDTWTSINVGSTGQDFFCITAQAWALLFNNPSWSPVNWQVMVIRIKDNWTARALTYGSQFRASSDLALPTTTILSKTLYMQFIWNTTDSKWDLVWALNNF